MQLLRDNLTLWTSDLQESAPAPSNEKSEKAAPIEPESEQAKEVAA